MQFPYENCTCTIPKNLKGRILLNAIENRDHVIFTNKMLHSFTNKSEEKRAQVNF